MFLYALGFLLGSLSLLIIENSTQSVWVGGFAVISLLILLTLRLVGIIPRATKITLIQCFLLGLVWSNLAVQVWSHFSNNLIQTPQVAQVEGVICSIPSEQDSRWRFDFCVTTIGQESITWPQRNRLRVYWGQYSPSPERPLKAGQSWTLSVKLRPIHGRVNPAGFDYEKWLVGEGYLGTASVKRSAKYLSASNWENKFHQIRQRVFDHFNSLIPESANKPLMLALLMGERAAISDQQWRVFQQSGTSHLLAISGLHIGIAALWSYWLMFLFWRQSKRLCDWLPAQLVAEVASLIGALSLSLLSGFGLPAQRALLMISIFLISRWRGRHLDLLNVLGWSLLIILTIQPFAVLQTSFWLSFSAVLIIGLVVHRQALQPVAWLGWLKVNWYLYIALFPLSWLFFDEISWVALIANLILIPTTTFVLTPLLYIGALASSLSETIASGLFQVAELVLHLGFYLQTTLAEFNQSFDFVALNSLSASFLFLLVGLALLPQKILSPVLYIPLVLCVLLPVPRPTDKPELSLWIFDVGQGLAIYMETPGNNLLYDTAWGNAQYATADSTLLPFFKHRQITSLDKLIISHGDADHVGGLNLVRQNLQVSAMLAGEPLTNVDAVDCHQTTSWQWSQVKFEFLKSGHDDSREGNNSSCVLSITIKEKRILLTGDIEKKAEKYLLANDLSRHDILVVPHHGSETSSTVSFVERVRPQHAIFSTGYDNQWKFPRKAVVDRYENIGSQIWTTHIDGAIVIRIKQTSELEIEGLRQSEARFWR